MTEELRDVVQTVLSRHTDWRPLAEQVGVAGLAIPESYGGAGAGLSEVHVVLEELGRTLVPNPLLSCVLAGQALLLAGDDEACQRLLPALASGSITGSVFWDPSLALDADGADLLLLVRNGSLFEVSGSVTPLVPMDPARGFGSVRIEDTRLLGDVDEERLRDIACVALSAEQVGAAARALELTVEYTKTRVQFGRPIGAFQAVQHRLADMHVMVEAARAVSYAAVEGRTHPSVAKVYCSEVLAHVAAEMIQLHGGIGITWEHHAHLYFKRAHSAWHLFGQPREHLRRLADWAGTGSADVL